MADAPLVIARIPLTNGGEAIIDAGDLPLVAPHSWHCTTQANGPGYANARIKVDGVWTTLGMHRLLMNPPVGFHIDHRDGNGLNNRRSNLRLATRSQNLVNRGPNRKNITGYKGVMWDEQRGLFRAQINWLGKNYRIGRYATAEEAAHAYDARASEWHGEFARLNFPKG